MKILEYYFQMTPGLKSKAQARDLGWLFRYTLNGIDINEWQYRDISEKDAAVLAEGVNRLANDEPLAYILGTADFYWCKINVSPDVLIPRPETENLCDIIATQTKETNCRMLDLCTGSGCIAIALKKAKPTWTVDAVDISPKAVEIARQNASQNAVDVNIFESDMWQNILAKYDIIVSNPPYIDSLGMANLPDSVRNYEPHLALFGGDDGLDYYRNIAANAPQFLNANGSLYLEVGDNQAGAIAELLRENFINIDIQKDLFGMERYVLARRK